MANPVVHFEIIGKDQQKLLKFYRSAFEWQIDDPIPELGNYAMVHTQTEGGIAGGIGGGIEGYDGHVTFYVEVADVNAALAKIEGLGGKKMMGPDEVPNGPIIAQFTDPEGHVVGLVQQRS
ncbi:MAG TPA: VOC family protein [Candidatus Baltobacteraceae bacterium]|jgi:hypothetical protein